MQHRLARRRTPSRLTGAGTVRRVLSLIASVLLISIGLVGFAGSAGATDSNQPDFWETETGETCYKIDTGAESGSYTMPAEPAGQDWSKLIIKKGSGNIGPENQVFNDPVAGQPYTWIGNDPTKSGGWSHLILCSVPETPEECVPEDYNGYVDGCGTPPEECEPEDYNGDQDGCGTPPEECEPEDYNGYADGCGTPPEECEGEDYNGPNEDGCGTPPDDCEGQDYNGDAYGCGTPPDDCEGQDYNGDEDGCGTPPEEEKPWICHPVNGNGELGNGWDLIPPDKASSHIDEALYPSTNPPYWKHMSNDGLRHDQYADLKDGADGADQDDWTCPGDYTPPVCPEDDDEKPVITVATDNPREEPLDGCVTPEPPPTTDGCAPGDVTWTWLSKEGDPNVVNDTETIDWTYDSENKSWWAAPKDGFDFPDDADTTFYLPADEANTCPPPPPPTDVCPNIPETQVTVPPGMIVDANGNCVTPPPPPTDVCPNIPGDQATVPDGMEIVDGICVEVLGSQPPDETRSESGGREGCRLGGVLSWTDTWTTTYAWDEELEEWVGTETGPVREKEFKEYTDKQFEKLCTDVLGEEETDDDENESPEVAGEEGTVPNAVDAGLASYPNGSQRNPLWLISVGGGLVLMGAAGWRRRETAVR